MSHPPLDPDLTRALQAIQDTFGADQARVVAVLPATPPTPTPESATPAAEQASLLGPEQHDPHVAAGAVPTGPSGEVSADA